MSFNYLRAILTFSSSGQVPPALGMLNVVIGYGRLLKTSKCVPVDGHDEGTPFYASILRVIPQIALAKSS